VSTPRVLISEPHAAGPLYLPYIWAILKSHWERNSAAREAVTWLDPLWRRAEAEGDLDEVCGAAPDVLGLSCYTWNWDLQLRVARWAKSRNPDCLVVAGGPEPDYKDPHFFRKHPDVDAVVVKDGEIPFAKILEAVVAGGKDFRHIPGLYLPSLETKLQVLDDPASAHIFTGPAEVPTVFDYSPYIEQNELYERIMTEHGKSWVMASLETNRGCPYSCSYCDWGSSTMSKLRKFEMSRVEAEIDWISRIGVKFLFLVDANWGIIPRDVEIADRLAEARAKNGLPKGMYYSSAKNNPDRTVEIVKRIYDAGLTAEHFLSVQHTDPEVLAATDRSNISPEKFREVVYSLARHGITTEVQLILGIPGDSVDKWKSCLAEMMNWGVHDNFQISPYSLLPNAPAADPRFMAKWEMKTRDLQLIPYGGVRQKNGLSCSKSKIVVGWRGFGDGDWVEVSAYSAFVKGFHNRALTRLPAIYLHFVHGVDYREFYDAIVDEFARESAFVAPLYSRVSGMFSEMLKDSDKTNEMELEDFPNCPFVVDAAKWLYVKSVLNLDEFYRDLSRFLVARFPKAKNLKSVIDYQEQMVITPDFRSRQGKSFLVTKNWPEFFRTAHSLMEYRPLEEPESWIIPRRAVVAGSKRVAPDNQLDFGEGTMSQRWERWLKQTINQHDQARFSNCPDPQIEEWTARGIPLGGLKLNFRSN